MDPCELTLVLANLIVGTTCAVPLAAFMRKTSGSPRKPLFWVLAMLGVYLAESVALLFGMGIPVFTVGLAFVWGIVFGRWMLKRMDTRSALKTSVLLSLYSSLPSASFILVPIMLAMAGRNVLSAAQGQEFGIPAAFPLGLNTILGFYAACAGGALLLKTLITTGEVRLLFRYGKNP